MSPPATPPLPDIDHPFSLTKLSRLVSILPGLGIAAAATLAAGYISDHYHAPLTLMALLIGLALNFLNADARLLPGLTFASVSLLRLGIVLVGARVTFGEIVALGPVAFIAVIAILVLTLLMGVLAARLFGYDTSFGIVAGGAVAICGASAALALATVLGERRVSQSQLTLVLVGISAASSAALFFYPIIAHLMQLSDIRAGFLFGAAVHDVAQALGAGYSYSEVAGQTATIVKLTRVALLAPVMAITALCVPNRNGDGRKTGILPWFVIGFFIMAAAHSYGMIAPALGAFSQNSATALLAVSVTATGIRAPMASLLDTGARPLLVILAASMTALGLSLLAVAFLIP